MSQEKVFSGNTDHENNFLFTYKIPTAPCQEVEVILEAVTVNNTIITEKLNIPPLPKGTASTWPYDLNLPLDKMIFEGEELEDGVLAF